MDGKGEMIEKVRKLLALAQSSNVHEAEAAMRKATNLMEEYEISMSQVIMDDLRRDGVVEGQVHTVSETWRSFVRRIGDAAGKIFDCKTVGTGEQSEFYFVGAKQDIECANILFGHLFAAWKSVLGRDTKQWKIKEEQWLEEGDKLPQYEVKKYQISHGQGFSDTVLLRAIEMQKHRQANVKAATGTARVVVKDAAIKEWMDKNTKPGKGTFKRQSGGYLEGKRAGENVVLNTAVTGSGTKKIGG